MRTRELMAGEDLSIDLIAVLEETSREAGYTPDQDRQRAVIMRLPHDLLFELAGHVRCAYIEQQKFSHLRGEPFDPDDFDDAMVLRGKLFELLVAADPTLYNDDPIAEELLALMHDPERFGLEERLGYFRTPDAAYLSVDRGEDGLVVRAIAEAKLGRLNTRAMHQLSVKGFRRGIEHMISCVNSIDHPEKNGLVATAAFFGGHASRLAISDDFHQTLVVPAHRDIEDAESLFGAKDAADSLYSITVQLLSDPERMTVRKSAFSASEVAAMTTYLYGLMQQQCLVASTPSVVCS